MQAKTLAVILLAAMAGCATREGFRNTMNGWVGSSESRLISGMGPPNSSYTLADGSKVLQYTRTGSMQLGGATIMQPTTSTTTGRVGNTGFNAQTTTYQAVQQPTYNVPLSCTVNFTLDASGTVTGWNSSGNHCVN